MLKERVLSYTRDKMLCPGCDVELKDIGMLGAFSPDNHRIIGPYAVCPSCAEIIQHGPKDQHDDLLLRIELAVTPKTEMSHE